MPDCCRIMPESPRWLLSMGRKDQVVAIMQEAARANKLTLPASLDKQLQQVSGAAARVLSPHCTHTHRNQ